MNKKRIEAEQKTASPSRELCYSDSGSRVPMSDTGMIQVSDSGILWKYFVIFVQREVSSVRTHVRVLRIQQGYLR